MRKFCPEVIRVRLHALDQNRAGKSEHIPAARETPDGLLSVHPPSQAVVPQDELPGEEFEIFIFSLEVITNERVLFMAYLLKNKV